MENRFKKIREEYSEERKDQNPKEKIYSIDEMCKEFQEMGFNISASRIKKIESNTPGAKIDSEMLLAYKKKFNVSADWLIDNTVATKQLTGDVASASKITGLSDESVTILRNESTNEEKLVLDILIKSSGLTFITNAIYEYFKSVNKTVEIKGYGANQELSRDAQRSILDYINTEYTKKIFSMLTREKEITNYFMRKATIEWLELFRNITNSQSKDAKFITQNNATFDKQIKEVEKTDYYKQWNSNK